MSQRPLPTFGLRLGLMMVFLMVGVAPLIKVYVAYRLNASVERFEVLLGVPFDLWTQLVGVGATLTLVTTVVAWRGRPTQVYWLFQAVLLLTTIAIGAEAAVRAFAECENCVVDPARDAINISFQCILPLQILTVVYMLWYINRKPARAFYGKGIKEIS